MSKRQTLKLLLLGVGLAISVLAQAQNKITTVEVFVDNPLSVPAIPYTRITVFDLSRVAAVKATAPRFPAEAESSAMLAKSWLQSPPGKEYIEKLKAAYEGRTRMVGYGILKLPAVVFEQGKYVVYGTTDVLQAVKDYDDYLREHPGGQHDK